MAFDSERKKRVTSALEDQGLDAFLCGSASAVLLLTGYWPVVGPSLAIFTRSGEAHLIVPEDEAELAHNTSDAELTSYKPAELDTLKTPIRGLTDPLRTVTAHLGLASAKIGIQMHLGMQPASYAASIEFRSSLLELLRSLQPAATYLACDNLIEKMKARKTPVELDLMRRSVAVASAGFEKAAEAIEAGRRETEVAASIQAAFETSPSAASFQRSYGFFYCMSGPNSALASAAYARTRQRRIEPGDLVMIHANTCGDGYWTDITRSYTAGKPSARQEQMRSAIHAARNEALNSIRPGVAARDVDRAARSVMEAHGLGSAFKHAAGHGVGFAAANANGHPRIHPHSPDILEAGMTFNLEPAAYFDGYGGMRHCDIIEVTADGASVLTQF